MLINYKIKIHHIKFGTTCRQSWILHCEFQFKKFKIEKIDRIPQVRTFNVIKFTQIIIDQIFVFTNLRSSRRNILPVWFFGISSINSTPPLNFICGPTCSENIKKTQLNYAEENQNKINFKKRVQLSLLKT